MCAVPFIYEGSLPEICRKKTTGEPFNTCSLTDTYD